MLLVLVAAAVAVRSTGVESIEWVRTFLVIFGSLLVQALPFVVIGALAAALVEIFVPVAALERLGRLPGPCSCRPLRSRGCCSRSASAARCPSRAD